MIPQDTPGLPIAAGSGAIDLTGNITAEAYFQQTVWGLRKAPYLGVRPLIWSHKKNDRERVAYDQRGGKLDLARL